ncbi:MAG TPA: hypothetical protein VFM05_06045 [Candidatus Saccharimonadales bacterium]|nr:hypothetical protein [Candidatus Saccharimonadales bacterium]
MGNRRSTREPAKKKAKTTPDDWRAEWATSTVSEEMLKKLVDDGLLPEQAVAGWRSAEGEKTPYPDTHQLVVFVDYFLRGFGLPLHPFVRGLLEYYDISLCHLHPNSMLHISIFIHYCETYLGIAPHFNLFRHFFNLKRSGQGSGICGGVYLQLRDGMAERYIAVPLNTNVKDWSRKWFYIADVEPYTRCAVDVFPERKPSWYEKPTYSQMVQVDELLKLIDRENLNGVGVAANFLFRRVQPCKQRVHPGYEYRGDNDPTREQNRPLGKDECKRRLEQMFAKDTSIATKGMQNPFSVSNPPPPQVLRPTTFGLHSNRFGLCLSY